MLGWQMSALLLGSPPWREKVNKAEAEQKKINQYKWILMKIRVNGAKNQSGVRYLHKLRI